MLLSVQIMWHVVKRADIVSMMYRVFNSAFVGRKGRKPWYLLQTNLYANYKIIDIYIIDILIDGVLFKKVCVQIMNACFMQF